MGLWECYEDEDDGYGPDEGDEEDTRGIDATEDSESDS